MTIVNRTLHDSPTTVPQELKKQIQEGTERLKIILTIISKRLGSAEPSTSDLSSKRVSIDKRDLLSTIPNCFHGKPPRFVNINLVSGNRPFTIVKGDGEQKEVHIYFNSPIHPKIPLTNRHVATIKGVDNIVPILEEWKKLIDTTYLQCQGNQSTSLEKLYEKELCDSEVDPIKVLRDKPPGSFCARIGSGGELKVFFYNPKTKSVITRIYLFAHLESVRKGIERQAEQTFWNAILAEDVVITDIPQRSVLSIKHLSDKQIITAQFRSATNDDVHNYQFDWEIGVEKLYEHLHKLNTSRKLSLTKEVRKVSEKFIGQITHSVPVLTPKSESIQDSVRLVMKMCHQWAAEEIDVYVYNWQTKSWQKHQTLPLDVSRIEPEIQIAYKSSIEEQLNLLLKSMVKDNGWILGTPSGVLNNSGRAPEKTVLSYEAIDANGKYRFTLFGGDIERPITGESTSCTDLLKTLKKLEKTYLYKHPIFNEVMQRWKYYGVNIGVLDDEAPVKLIKSPNDRKLKCYEILGEENVEFHDLKSSTYNLEAKWINQFVDILEDSRKERRWGLKIRMPNLESNPHGDLCTYVWEKKIRLLEPVPTYGVAFWDISTDKWVTTEIKIAPIKMMLEEFDKARKPLLQQAGEYLKTLAVKNGWHFSDAQFTSGGSSVGLIMPVTLTYDPSQRAWATLNINFPIRNSEPYLEHIHTKSLFKYLHKPTSRGAKIVRRSLEIQKIQTHVPITEEILKTSNLPFQVHTTEYITSRKDRVKEMLKLQYLSATPELPVLCVQYTKTLGMICIIKLVALDSNGNIKETPPIQIPDDPSLYKSTLIKTYNTLYHELYQTDRFELLPKAFSIGIDWKPDPVLVEGCKPPTANPKLLEEGLSKDEDVQKIWRVLLGKADENSSNWLYRSDIQRCLGVLAAYKSDDIMKRLNECLIKGTRGASWKKMHKMIQKIYADVTLGELNYLTHIAPSIRLQPEELIEAVRTRELAGRVFPSKMNWVNFYNDIEERLRLIVRALKKMESDKDPGFVTERDLTLFQLVDAYRDCCRQWWQTISELYSHLVLRRPSKLDLDACLGLWFENLRSNALRRLLNTDNKHQVNEAALVASYLQNNLQKGASSRSQLAMSKQLGTKKVKFSPSLDTGEITSWDIGMRSVAGDQALTYLKFLDEMNETTVMRMFRSLMSDYRKHVGRRKTLTREISLLNDKWISKKKLSKKELNDMETRKSILEFLYEADYFVAGLSNLALKWEGSTPSSSSSSSSSSTSSSTSSTLFKEYEIKNDAGETFKLELPTLAAVRRLLVEKELIREISPSERRRYQRGLWSKALNQVIALSHDENFCYYNNIEEISCIAGEPLSGDLSKDIIRPKRGHFFILVDDWTLMLRWKAQNSNVYHMSLPPHGELIKEIILNVKEGKLKKYWQEQATKKKTFNPTFFF